METCRFYIGTSGWSYPHWQERFYPASLPKSHWFQYYSQQFNTVEVNATFYRRFQDSTYQKWYEKAPSGFRYVLKAPKIITHRKFLVNADEDIQTFWCSASRLQDKLGLILLQLAPSTPYDPERLKNALLAFPEPGKVAVEFRHKRWLTDEIIALLTDLGVVFCNVDSPKLRIHDILTASKAYLRLHGKEAWYNYYYSQSELAGFAEVVKLLSKRGASEIYAFFNNDTDAYAVENAKTLKAFLSKE